jgi:hypothetical protein
MNPIFTKTQTVNLIVVDCCPSDTMQVNDDGGIADYVYYINENTEKDVWDFGTTPVPKVKTWLP